MTLLWIFVSVALAVIWVLTIVDLVRQRYSAGVTIGWLALVLLLPYAGAIIYWIVRKPRDTEAEQAYLAQASAREQLRR